MNRLVKRALGAQSRPLVSETASKLQEGLRRHSAGEIAEAASLYGEVLSVEPHNFDALHLLGVAALQTGHPADALSLFDQAAAIDRKRPELWTNRATALLSLDRCQESLESCETALGIDPGNAVAHFNAGNALVKLRRRHDAINRFNQAVSLNPSYVEAWTNLGGELIEDGRLDEAIKALDTSIRLNDQHAKAHLNLGVARMEVGRLDEAEAAFQSALSIEPGYAKAATNIANLAWSQSRVAKADAFVTHALQADPQCAEAHNVQGNVLRTLGEPRRATECFQRAVDLDPSSAGFHSNLLLSRLGDPTSGPSDILADARLYAARHAPWTRRQQPRREAPVRLGFVSPDLRTHPVGLFLEPLLTGLQDVEVFLYSNCRTEDQQTERLRQLSSSTTSIYRADTDDVCSTIRDDGIDLLIDLAGHTADGRLDVFAKRPAPAQVTWLGYSGTTGLSQFDALIGDPVVTPVSHENDYSEPVYRHPSGFAPLLGFDGLPDIGTLPLDRTGTVTFGSFNSPTKINEEVIEAWSEVLRKVPHSRMVLKNTYFADADVCRHFADKFSRYGVAPDRLDFQGPSSLADHWPMIASVDLVLDTFPYSGATTTLDCLRMGVPVVTVCGDRYCSRMSASFLSSAGLQDPSAELPCDFVTTSVALASDGERLRDLRTTLRDRLMAAPFADPELYASQFLSLLHDVWADALDQAA